MEVKNVALGDDDYLPLDALSLSIEEGEPGTFTLCFWIYLLKTSKPGLVIRQGQPDRIAAVPFLTLDADRKLVLHPLTSVGSNKSEELVGSKLVVSDQVCPMEKWVHIGCEIGSPVTRLHMGGTVVGERHISSSEVIEEKAIKRETIFLFGGEGNAASPSLQGFVYYVRLLPQPTVTNHFVKNPPLELLLDGPSGASDDYELEEGGDGVWSVVGGKASCRRNFALDVALLDALGRSVHKEMELVAFLVFADTGLPVEKPKDDAEAPLLTTFDGVEFPSSERPIKLVHGRASFKLKISQLSSKCDNRLFRVCFDSPSTSKFPFLQAYSRPIRCVSRNRNHRTPVQLWKHPYSASFPLDGSVLASGEENVTTDSLHSINDATVAPTAAKDACYLSGQLPLKRTRPRLQKEAPVLVHGHGFLQCPSDNKPGVLVHSDAGSGLQIGLQLQNSIHPAASVVSGLGWPGGPARMSPVISRQPDRGDNLDLAIQQETFAENKNHLTTTVTDEMSHPQRWKTSLSDHLVFKYCLESMHDRGEFLKAFVMSKSDQELNDFATRVSQLTGCRHDGYQILIARNLLCSGNEFWSKVSQESSPPFWANVAMHIDQSFTASGSLKRSLSAKDKEFLKRIAGCGDFISREQFERLWNWFYPVALAVRSSPLRSTWDTEDPRWIEGMISQEEVEELLKSGETISKPGTFLLWFPGSRLWPHPDSGALVVSYVGHDMRVNHKLLSLDETSGLSNRERPLPEQLLSQPELKELCKVSSPGVTG